MATVNDFSKKISPASYRLRSQKYEKLVFLFGFIFAITLSTLPSFAQDNSSEHKTSNSENEADYDPCEDQRPSPTQLRMINEAWRNASSRSKGKCAHYVKNAFEKAYGIRRPTDYHSPDRGRGIDAYEMITAYKLDQESSGFKKCEYKNPALAPPGCLVFYDSYARRGAGRPTPIGSFPPRDRSGWNLYYGHVEIITNKPANGDAPYMAVSDFKQEGGPIIATNDPKVMDTGWGMTRNRAREYQVIGIYCRR